MPDKIVTIQLGEDHTALVNEIQEALVPILCDEGRPLSGAIRGVMLGIFTGAYTAELRLPLAEKEKVLEDVIRNMRTQFYQRVANPSPAANH